MNKKSIIFICTAIAVGVAILLILLFAFTVRNKKNINLIIYDEEFGTEKTVKITNKKQIKELNKIFNNCSLEQDETTPYLAIEKDVEVEIEEGKSFIVQLDLDQYCYYENKETNTELTIKMPDGLLQIINDNVKENI